MDATFASLGEGKNPSDKWAYSSSLMSVHHCASILIGSGSVLAETVYKFNQSNLSLPNYDSTSQYSVRFLSILPNRHPSYSRLPVIYPFYIIFQFCFCFSLWFCCCTIGTVALKSIKVVNRASKVCGAMRV
jgi:hypothetical protein